jgi:flagellar hook-length control protein FliK
MNIESIGIQNGTAQGQAQGGKSAAANDPLAALFAEFLDLAGALVPGGTADAAKKVDETSAEQQSAQLMAAGAGMPFLKLPVTAQSDAVSHGAGAAAASAVKTASAQTASALTASAGTPGAAMPRQGAKPEADTAALEAAASAAPAESEKAKSAGTAPQPAAKTDAALPPLAINLAPSVTLAPPKTEAPVGAEKAKPVASAGGATKSTAPVSVTIEKAQAQPNDAGHRAEAPMPVAAVVPAEPKDEPATAPAKPEVTASVLPAPASLAPQAPTDKPLQPQATAVPVHDATQQVVHRVEKAIEHGEDRIRIELKPASLGGVEVHLHIADDGRVSAVVRADRADTLALLQNDVRGLEQALKDAGLRPDAGSLSFNLRQGEGQAGNQPDARGQRRRGNSEREAFTIEGVSSEAPGVRNLLSGLDIRI